ncbi:hypothetical protein BEP19_16805 [Ammoniphilus oxalaticus]|uniref:DUF8208 domain-containing protein n=1 Tax=Ammoniphilus oxalaticus TaxID=66863 RepID=A0A419SQ74_9BACL|nr:hypothetical protein [Ammoniphilus oxalaticus]RKD26497.1 hypothetical protein BEP19_16805 [Ammoniphilus oxalaticus]
MSDGEIIIKLEQFEDYLTIGSVFSDPFRWIGWVLIKGLSLMLDGLEKVTNEVLMIKLFFDHPDIAAFVSAIRPFLYLLLAFSLIYAGYLLIFQKKFNREGMAVNLFVALSVLALLGVGMEKANEFTDEAIQAIGSQQVYEEQSGTLSQNILSRNIYDLIQFDSHSWSSAELDQPNTIPFSMIGGISITEKFDSSRKELDMSEDGKDLSKKQLMWNGFEKELSKLDQGMLSWNNQYYYRYSPDWITLATTIVVMAFTLFSIAYKLARLSYELAFNYVLAMIISPVDLHDGQKTKKILQSILNTFVVIILIFLSMKVYMVGTAYLANQLNGFAYLVALIAFSVAVIDGPNIVERIFGIDAGLKSGWGVLAGAYAGYRMVNALGSGVNGLARQGAQSNDKNRGTPSSMRGGGHGEKAPSPNDGEKGEENNRVAVPGTDTGGSNTGGAAGSETETGSIPGLGSVSRQTEEPAQRKQTRAPSPNDHERGMGGFRGLAPSFAHAGVGAISGAGSASMVRSMSRMEPANVSDQAMVHPNADASRAQPTVSGSTTDGGSASRPSSAGVQGTRPVRGGSSSMTRTASVTDTAKVTDQTTVQQNTDVSSVQQTVQGATTEHVRKTGASATPRVSNRVERSAMNQQTVHETIASNQEIAVTRVIEEKNQTRHTDKQKKQRVERKNHKKR